MEPIKPNFEKFYLGKKLKMSANLTAKKTMEQSFFGLIDSRSLFIILSISILIDLVCLAIILRAKKNLKPIEFYLLLGTTILTLLSKIYFIFSIYLIFKNLKIKKIICVFIYSLKSIVTINNYIWFYYSLFHLSFLNRSNLFLKLNNYLQKKINFFIYLLIVSILIYIFCLTFVFIFKNEIFVVNSESYSIQPGWEYGENKIFLCDILFDSFPTILTLMVYNTSIFLIIKRIFFKKIHHSLNELKHQKKFLKVILKFFLFNIFFNFKIVIFLIILLRIITNLSTINVVIRICFTVTFLIVSVNSLMLLVINKILKKQFIDMIKQFIQKLRKFFD